MTEPKDLIDLEDLFRQKKLKEKSLADLAIMGLEPYLEDLPDKNRIMTAGSASTKGGNYKGSIRAAGTFSSKGVTVTNKLTTAGTASVRDLIVVKNNTTLAGTSIIHSNAVFAGKTRLAGTVEAKENIIASTSLNLSGTIRVNKQIIADGPISASGTLIVDQIQSLDDIHVRGKIQVNRNIIAKKFQLTRGGGEIKGDLIAREAGIGTDRRLKRYLRNYENDLNLYNPITLIKYVGGLIFGPLISRKKETDRMIIDGDIISHDIFLENVIVNGNLNAKRITIGDNVIIKGVVEYSQHLEVLSEAEYDLVKINEAELKYIDTTSNLEFLEDNTEETDKKNK